MKNKNLKKAIFLTDEEYETIFTNFCSFRGKISFELIDFGLLESNYIIDLAAGHGFLSFAINNKEYKGKILCIGLPNDFNSYRRVIESGDYTFKNIQYCIMDASQMGFRDGTIDFITNFLGLEDINMIGGKKAVRLTLLETSRILRNGGILQISILLKGSEPSSKVNWKLWKYIGLNSIFYKPKFYSNKLKKLGFDLLKSFQLKTHKKMTLNQAKEEILFACKEAPKIFNEYKVKSKSFKKVWDKFENKIKKYGLGFYPEILILIFQK
ncbi:MAG: class I SAM-dependent methyltransferase [Promethearchaeota archaeon]